MLLICINILCISKSKDLMLSMYSTWFSLSVHCEGVLILLSSCLWCISCLLFPFHSSLHSWSSFLLLMFLRHPLFFSRERITLQLLSPWLHFGMNFLYNVDLSKRENASLAQKFVWPFFSLLFSVISRKRRLPLLFHSNVFLAAREAIVILRGVVIPSSWRNALFFTSISSIIHDGTCFYFLNSSLLFSHSERALSNTFISLLLPSTQDRLSSQEPETAFSMILHLQIMHVQNTVLSLLSSSLLLPLISFPWTPKRDMRGGID